MELIGRARELGQLRQSLAGALTGGGRLLLLSGEPGIGKTRLVDELTGGARAAGVPVVWGRAWEAGGAPAYWPWTAALESLVSDLDEASLLALRATVGPGLSALHALLPDLAARLGGGPTATPPSAEEARFRLFRAVTALLRRAASAAGLIVVLEDLHAADEPSLLLLHFVAREARGSRLLLIGTFRDTEANLEPAVQELLARIAREGTSLTVPRLPREDALQLLQRHAGGLAPALAQRICDRTQGNPLFLEELARSVEASGAEPGHAAETTIPAGIRAVIRQRLDRVAPPTRALLELAAVAGDEIDPALLALAGEQPRAVVNQELEQAGRAGLVAERAAALRFGHALVREVLYQSLTDDRRRALHGSVAQAMQDPRRDPSKREPAAERAHHLLAGPLSQLPQAVDAAIAAADEALAQLAYEEAVQGLERAAAAVEAAGGPASSEGPVRARLALALGRAHVRRGDGPRGKVFCREAARLARQLGDGVLLARAALSYGDVFAFGVVDPVLIDLLEEALAALPQSTPGCPPEPLRNTLRARLAAALQPSARTMGPVQVAREAIVGARALGDRRHLLDTISAGMAAMMDVAPPRERLALNLEAEDLALALGDQEVRLRTLGRLVVDHMGLGDFAAADVRIAAYEALAREQHAPWMAWRGPLFRSMRAMLHGRFAEAEGHIAEAERIGQELYEARAGQRDNQRDSQLVRCLTMHRESLLRVAERHDEMPAQELACRPHRAIFFVGHAWQASASALNACRMEDREKTQLHLGLIPSEDFPPIDNLFALFHCAEPVAFAGDLDRAEILHRLISAVADEDVMLGMTQLSWEGPAVRLLALLEARLSRWSESDAHFAAALARLTHLGAAPLAARTRYEWGRALLARDQPRALALIAAARAEAEALGMPGLVALAAARLGTSTIPTVTAPAPAAPTPLPFAFSNEGEVWAVQHQGATFRLKDSLGLRYLARLLAEPDREIHVLELAGGADGEGGEAVDSGDAGELLDEEARRSYKERLEDLRDQLEEATSFGDAARAARLREELEFLGAELSRATGLGGRARRAGSAAERARSAVQRRIKNALARVAEQDAPLAAYLTRTVRTGNFCVFRPGR